MFSIHLYFIEYILPRVRCCSLPMRRRSGFKMLDSKTIGCKIQSFFEISDHITLSLYHNIKYLAELMTSIRIGLLSQVNLKSITVSLYFCHVNMLSNPSQQNAATKKERATRRISKKNTIRYRVMAKRVAQISSGGAFNNSWSSGMTHRFPITPFLG